MRRGPRAAAVQLEAASILYARLIQRDGPATVQAVGAELGVVDSTITRQATGDIPVQLRTMAALMHLDPEGGRLMLDAFGRELGVAWKPSADVAQAGAVTSKALRMVSRCSALVQTLAEALDDGELDPTEREEARHKLAALEHQSKAFLAALDAMEPDAGGLRAVVR